MAKPPNSPGQKAGWCIHYVAPPHDMKAEHICAAGVAMKQFQGSPWPCFLDRKTGENKPDSAPCEHLRRPTREEIAAHEKWISERFDILGTVITGIKPWRLKNKGKSASEGVECPACKGRLHLSISAYNGHVHGRCETQGCVSWME